MEPFVDFPNLLLVVLLIFVLIRTNTNSVRLLNFKVHIL